MTERMRSVYIVGGVGAGKSTFTGQLLDHLSATLGPKEELHAVVGPRARVTLSGHTATVDGRAGLGLYLGVMRDNFPGTDGLARDCVAVMEDWLPTAGQRFDWLLSEGNTLGFRRALQALADHSDLLVLHAVVDPAVQELRLLQRGSTQKPTFVAASLTKARNLAAWALENGIAVHSFDSTDPVPWDQALDIAYNHLLGVPE